MLKKLSKQEMEALVGIFLIPTISFAQQVDSCPSLGAKLADLLLLRPICLAGSCASTALCVAVSVPATLMGAGTEVGEVLFVAPWHYTVDRPLGDFNHYKDGRSVTAPVF